MYFRRHFGYEEHNFVTGFQNDDATLIEEKRKLLIRQRPGHAGTQRKESQVKLLLTNNAFYILQRATAQSKTGVVRGYVVAEAPPFFFSTKLAGLTVRIFSLFSSF
jgi:hypothetical protein